MMGRALSTLLGCAVVVLALPGPAATQTTSETDPDSVPLVFEREVFHYPQFDRRNPFRPLTGDLDGPRFEELRLLGTILSSEPGRSVALIGSGETASVSYRLRVGEVLGNMRVLEIQQSRVIVEVEEFGVRDQRTLELRRSESPQPQRMFRPREPEPDTLDEPGSPPVDTSQDTPGGQASPGFDATVRGGRR